MDFLANQHKDWPYQEDIENWISFPTPGVGKIKREVFQRRQGQELLEKANTIKKKKGLIGTYNQY